MEDKFKELLELHRSRFVNEINVERLFSSLEQADVLSSGDIDVISQQPSKPAQVEKLLDILTNKRNSAFKNLCLALETTYPHLLTVMFLGNNQRVLPDTSRSPSLTSDSEEDVLTRSRNADTRSQELKTYTRIIPSHEYDLPESAYYDKQHQHDVNIHGVRSKRRDQLEQFKLVAAMNGERSHGDHQKDYDWLKSQCEHAMTELQSLKRQQADTMKRYDQAMKETESYRQSYKTSVNQLQQSREEMSSVKTQYTDLLTEKKKLEQEVQNLQKLREEDKHEMAELRKQHREVVSESGSNEILNALDMYDRIKQDYDDLRERYAELAANHSSVVSKLETANEENFRIQGQYKSLCMERDEIIKERNQLKQQCTTAIRNWHQVLHERSEMNEDLGKITKQRDEYMKEMNTSQMNQLQVKKNLESVMKDRDAALREYQLVMSERDQVHKEMEQLQDKLNDSLKQAEVFTKDKKGLQDEIESLKREIKSALEDRDKAVKDRKEICDKYGEVVSKRAELETQRDDFKTNYEMATQERDIARKERHEAIQDRDRILRETYERERNQKEKAEEMDHFNKETEILKKQIEKLQRDFSEAQQEAEICKMRRDWAFGERDKIVHERDSIRTLCDNLRRDRDRAVSDLAQALRDHDEMKKQKCDAVKDLKELRDRYEFMNEKETRKSQLNSVAHNHSRDSAIDADLQEWETETLDIEISGLNVDNLGFELVGGKDDPQFPNDNAIFVSHVTKGSPADGKLKVNDLLVRINNIDVTNVDKRAALQAFRNRSGIVNLVVKRRKLTPVRIWQPVQVNIPPGKDLGIQLEQGMFISHVAADSYTGKEGFLLVGDRIVSVNGRSVENMTANELLKVMYQAGDTLMVDVWRQTSPVNSAGSSPTPGLVLQDPYISSSNNNKKDVRGRDQIWEMHSDSSKGSLKNIKTSGSQTDSLDSPGVPRRQRKSPDSKENIDPKNRHSVHVFDKVKEKVEKMVRHRHKSQEQEEKDKHSKNVVNSRMVQQDIDEDVLGEFAFPLHNRDNSGSGRSNSRKRELEQENSGTWPKCVRGISANANGTVIVPPPHKRRERPTLDAVINRPVDSIPTAKVPPLPPERTNASFVGAVRHSPQSSDSTIRYSSHSPSPLSSPNPSKSTPYLTANFGTTNRGSYLQEPTISNDMPPSYYRHNNMNKVNNSKNPPRMPPIHTSVQTGQYDLQRISERPISGGRAVMRPGSASKNRERQVPSQGPYSSHIPSHMDYNMHTGQPDVLGYNSRLPHSRNSTPEPLPSSPPPPPTPKQFTDTRPVGPHQYPQPRPSNGSINSNNSLISPSQMAVTRYHEVFTPTITKYFPPRHSLPPASLQDSLHENDPLPPYVPSDWPNSPSPSQLSSSIDRFTPTPSEPYSFRGSTSPTGRSLHELESSTLPRHHKHLGHHERIRIPSASNTSVHTPNTSGSVEVVSDRDSPCSPFLIESGHMSPTLPIEPVTYRKKPLPGETRRINIEKASNLVGFKIETGPSGGIFVSSVHENSLAAQAGLVIGDQLLEVCGVNMRNATYELAQRVLQHCGNSLTMLVQYNPKKYSGGDSDSSDSNSAHTSPANSPGARRNLVSPSDSIHRRGPSSSSMRESHRSSSACESPRKISFKKSSPNTSLGVTLVGGNAVGIFVHEVQPDSPVFGHDGLHCGDQILEYNGTNFRSITAEEASMAICKPCSSIRIKAQYNPARYDGIRNKPGDSFYIRAHFDRPAENEGELSFRKDDILYVDNTVFDVKQGLWYAWLVDDDGKKLKGGTIPSKESLSESLSLHDSEELKGPTRRGSGSARRSFFRRSKKHQRNNSKDSRELNSFSETSLNSDSVPVLDDMSLCTYTTVEKMEYKLCRPVILFAPLGNALIQKLSAESPDKYYFCEPSIMQTSSSVMEQGLKDGNFIDYWMEDNHFMCIRVASVRDICNKGIHCLLNVNPLAVERLQRLQIYPIVIYARHKSHKQLREVKDVQFLPDKLSNKSSRDLFEYFQKIEQDYRHLFSATIQGGNLAEMCQQIKNVISAEQSKAIWVPSSSVKDQSY